MPRKTWAIGEEVLASDFNPIVADQVVAVFPSAAARATGWPAPPTGATTFLTDTGSLECWNGTAWRKPWNMPWGLLAYAERTSDFGPVTPGGTDIPGLTVTVTIPANRRIKAASQVLINTNGGAFAIVTLSIYVTPATPSQFSQANATIPGAGYWVTQYLERIHTPAAGTYTYKTVLAGPTGITNVAAGVSYPASLVIEDLGPNGAPV